MSRTATFCLAAALCASTLGCFDRSHLTHSYGRAYRDAFAQQRVSANGADPGKAIKGLDSQEASIVSGSYRRGLAPKGTPAQNSSMIVLNPHAEAPIGAPSVAPAAAAPR